jgi:hypothetical protein
MSVPSLLFIPHAFDFVFPQSRLLWREGRLIFQVVVVHPFFPFRGATALCFPEVTSGFLGPSLAQFARGALALHGLRNSGRRSQKGW